MGVFGLLHLVQSGKPVFKITHNADAAISTATDMVFSSPSFGQNGEGVTVGVWDGGHVLDVHQELIGRVNLRDSTSLGSIGMQLTLRGPLRLLAFARVPEEWHLWQPLIRTIGI